MRRRLVTAFVGLTVAVITLYGVPRAYVLADLVEAHEQRKIERTVDLVEVVVLDRQERGVPVTPELLTQLVHEGERLEVAPAQGPAVAAGDAGETSSDRALVVSRTLPDGSEVTLARSAQLVEERVTQALMPLALMGLALVLLAGLAALWLSQRLSRPFRELAGAAQRLGAGKFDVEIPRYQIPEAELIGTALRDSAVRLDTMVRREREFSVQASHLLRTPITALRLDLEDVSLWPQTPPDVRDHLTASVAELDRLSSSITRLLEDSRTRDREAESFDLADEVRSVVTERESAADQQPGARLRHTPSEPLPVRLPREDVRSAVEHLLEHVLSGGPGGVTVQTLERPTHLLVRMVRDGDPHGGAAGDDDLMAGRERAASLGATVVMLVPPAHGLELMLPRRTGSG